MKAAKKKTILKSILPLLVLSLAALLVFTLFHHKENGLSLFSSPVFPGALSSQTTPSVLGEGQVTSAIAPNKERYTNTLVGFSFLYPKEFTISSFGSPYDETGETVLLQSLEAGLSGRDKERGLQILITPFDEDIILTVERIRKELPSLAVVNAKEVSFGSAAVSKIDRTAWGVIFGSKNSFMGKSHEAWFVFEKRLYQISAPADSEELFNEVVRSWKFR